MTRTVLVPPHRVVRWFENFRTRHGETVLSASDGRLVATAADGATARATLPWGRAFSPPAAVPELPGAFAEAAQTSLRWGVLLVRKGGFAVAAGTTVQPAVTKVGRRHVQGRTKAGGQSQQRFARRRDNQARAAFAAAADHAHRILVEEFGGVQALACGGDRTAVDSVLADPRLTALSEVRVEAWLDVPDPRRAVLDGAVVDAWSARVDVSDGG